MSSEKFLMPPVIVFLILLAKMKLTSETQAPTGQNLFTSDDMVK
jgi:hypothetical protein